VQVDERSLVSRLRSLRQPGARKQQADAVPAPTAPPRPPALDDYCLAMLLFEPTLYWKTLDLQIGPDDFPGTENRQLFAAFQAHMQAYSVFDEAALRATLDPALQSHLDRLLDLGKKPPVTNGESLENALTVAVLRGRKLRLNAEIAQMTHLLREAKQEDDRDAIATLTSRVHALSAELGQIGRQLDERTVLWRTRSDKQG